MGRLDLVMKGVPPALTTMNTTPSKPSKKVGRAAKPVLLVFPAASAQSVGQLRLGKVCRIS